MLFKRSALMYTVTVFWHAILQILLYLFPMCVAFWIAMCIAMWTEICTTMGTAMFMELCSSTCNTICISICWYAMFIPFFYTFQCKVILNGLIFNIQDRFTTLFMFSSIWREVCSSLGIWHQIGYCLVCAWLGNLVNIWAFYEQKFLRINNKVNE